MTKLLNSRAAAEYLGIPLHELHLLRCAGQVRAERVCTPLYLIEDLDAYAQVAGLAATYKINGETITLVYDDE